MTSHAVRILAALGAFLTATVLSATSPQVSKGPQLPTELQGIGIDQNLNAQVPLDTQFTDEDGNAVRLGKYFDQGPVLLALVYFRCPMLCSRVLQGVVSGLKPLRLTPGRDFNVVAISFDPEDSWQTARAQRLDYSKRYSSRAGTAGWHFLTGSPDSIRAVTEAVGFHYRWDPPSQMFVHATGVMVLTPEGQIARYFYGVEYQPKDLKLGLIEASHSTIGSAVDQILLFCYHYDPSTGKYSATVLRMLRGAGILVLVILGIALTSLWRYDLRRHRREGKESPLAP
jgi:protein SCO1/2